MSQSPDNQADRPKVMSPFDGAPPGTTTSGSPEPQPQPTYFKWMVVSIYSGVAALALAIGAILLWRHTVDNPYRTLEVFPTQKYFDNPQSLLGNRFRATLRVEGDLGWSPGIGKLMVFSVEGDPRFVPVLVQGDNQSYAFSKGQTYVAQITIKERGLIYATALKKN